MIDVYNILTQPKTGRSAYGPFRTLLCRIELKLRLKVAQERNSPSVARIDCVAFCGAAV